MSTDLGKKVNMAITFLQSIPDKEPIEIAYSGGKDSDVILELAKMAQINFKAIYKNTTIDPPGTISHVLSKGVEILNPKKSFFELVSRKGFPSRKSRFCCENLKEYKVLNRAILGIRRCESHSRAERYDEPEICREYSKKDPSKNARHYYPLLEWTNDDVTRFIANRGINCHPLYYDESYEFHVERRLGCLCCPLASRNHRLKEFLQYPNMVKCYIRAGSIYWNSHPSSPMKRYLSDVYEWFVMHLFCDSKEDFRLKFGENIFSGKTDCRLFLEHYFDISLK